MEHEYGLDGFILFVIAKGEEEENDEKPHRGCAKRWEVARREVQMLFLFLGHSNCGLSLAQISCLSLKDHVHISAFCS